VSAREDLKLQLGFRAIENILWWRSSGSQAWDPYSEAFGNFYHYSIVLSIVVGCRAS
jgi:hypothetical protein